jgi:DNA-binding transcriptional LysR family regulator
MRLRPTNPEPPVTTMVAIPKGYGTSNHASNATFVFLVCFSRMSQKDAELLRGFDLNLLRVLLTVLDLGNVTRAAKRLGLTQSATSRALERLRGEIGDPLFVRAGRGLVPTPRALALHEPLRDAFTMLSERLLSPTPFDPATTTRRFTVEARDYADATVLPPLLRLVEERAPHASMRIVRPEHAVMPTEVDLHLHPVRKKLGPHEELLFEEHFVLVSRHSHPALRKRPTAREIATLRHVLVAPEGGTSAGVDRLLTSLTLRRNIVVFVPGYTGLGHILEGSDLVAVLPSRIATAFAGHHRLRIHPLPLPLPPVRAGMSWHPRFDRDGGVHFLRAMMREACTRNERGLVSKNPK